MQYADSKKKRRKQKKKRDAMLKSANRFLYLQVAKGLTSRTMLLMQYSEIKSIGWCFNGKRRSYERTNQSNRWSGSKGKENMIRIVANHFRILNINMMHF